MNVFINLFTRLKKVGKKYSSELLKLFEYFKSKKDYVFRD